MTIGIGHVITIVVAIFTVGAIVIIAIWNAHRDTHSKADEKVNGLAKDLAELRDRISRLDGYLGRYYQSDIERERQEQDSSERQMQHSLERMELQNKKEEQNVELDG